MPKKILIVDDNEFVIEIMTYILHAHGYEVISLTNGEDVFDTVLYNHPDLVILDKLLPDMDGIDICRSLKADEDTCNVPVIICSGDTNITNAMQHSGAPNDTLMKPFDMDQFIEKVTMQLAA